MLELTIDLLASLESFPGVVASLGKVFGRTEASPHLAGVVDVISGPDALTKVAVRWRHLEGAGAGTVFQSLAVAEAGLQAHAAHGQTPHLVVVREGAACLVILPLVMTSMAGLKVLRFLGDPLIQYGDGVVSPSATPEHVAHAFKALTTLGADAALLRKVRDDALIGRALPATVQVLATDAAPFVDLDRGATLSGRDQRELRRLGRRLADQGTVRLEDLAGPERLAGIARALAWKREWLAGKGLSSLVIGDARWEKALLALAEKDELACVALRVGEDIAALEVAFRRPPHWSAFLGAINPAYARCGPGQVQMAETQAFARASGFETYDLLGPADPFKRAIATGEVAIRDYFLPLSLKGRLAGRALRHAPRMRAAAHRLPAGLRRRLLGAG